MRTQAAAYFVELIEIWTERDHHEPELFGLLRRAFGYLNTNEPNLRAVSHFETELARIAGVHDATKVEERTGFCPGQPVWKIAVVAHAPVEDACIDAVDRARLTGLTRIEEDR